MLHISRVVSLKFPIGQKYTGIGQQENCDLLRGPLKAATLQVSCSNLQRFVCLKQISPTWNGTNVLIIKKDFFLNNYYNQSKKSTFMLCSMIK